MYNRVSDNLDSIDTCKCPENMKDHSSEETHGDKFICTTCTELVIKNIQLSSDYLNIEIEFPVEITVINYYSKPYTYIFLIKWNLFLFIIIIFRFN